MNKDTKTPETKGPELLDYTVNAVGWVAGQARKAGEVIKLTAAAAKYENVTLKPADKAQAPKGKGDTAK